MTHKNTQTEGRRWRVTRRGFLIGMGAGGATLALGLGAGLPFARLKIASFLDSAGGPPGGLEAPPTTWFEVTGDNRVQLFVPKIEMGQGIHTALAQIAAEELDIAWEQVQVVQATTNSGLRDSMGTGASNSVSSLFTPLREAAATLREMLRQEAATQLSLSPEMLINANAVFTNKTDPEQAITFGAVVTAKTTEWEVPEEAPPLKPAKDFQMIGRSLPRVDLAAKLTGTAVYGYDARLPNMLYGAVARPPTLTAKLRQVAPGAAPARAGVEKVVIEKDFAGVVARTRREAYLGVAALDASWEDESPPIQQEAIEALVTVGNGEGVVIQKEGDARRQLQSGTAVIAEYRTPMAAHAHLEPQAALVDVGPEKVTAWVSTQSPFLVRGEIADVLGRDEEAVEIIPTYLGGGFGRRLNVEVAVEAARLSAAAGRPVHVGWNRKEEFQYGYLRPPTHNLLKATMSADGRIQAFEHQQASGDVALPFLPGIAAAFLGADFGAWRGALIQYDIPHKRTVAWRTKLPIRTGWWRGLGLLANTFALESFMDEIAAAVGVDPLALRLQHLPAGELGERYRRVLETAAVESGWGKPLAVGRALGIACSVDVGTVVAHVAEVSMDGDRLRVHRVTAVMDPGLVINPDGATAQTQGSIMMGLSSTFFEEATVQDSRIAADNFDRYPLLTMNEAPDVQVTLLNSGDTPFGVGEPPLGPIAAAVANAYFALSGRRLRRLPLRVA